MFGSFRCSSIQTRYSGKLYKLRIEENKSSWDADDKYNRRIMDEKSNDKDDEIKQKQLEEQVKDRYFKVGIAAAELMIPLMFYGIWMDLLSEDDHGMDRIKRLSA